MKCTLLPFGALVNYQFVVVLSRFRGQWMLSRHRQRGTWELQGGHVEQGETPRDAARRELYEESGAMQFLLTPVCDYRVEDDDGVSNGACFLAGIEVLGSLPASEMAQVAFFDEIPENLTYPGITPLLLAECMRQHPELA